MFHHHNVLAVLPDVYQSEMGQEYDRDKPPYTVFSGIFFQGWQLIQANWKVPNMSLYVVLVAFQIEAFVGLPRKGLACSDHQAIQCIRESGYRRQFGCRQDQGSGTAFGQHLSDPLPLPRLSLSRLGHLPPEVLTVKDKAVKVEPRGYISATLLAPITSHVKHGLAVTSRAPLESNGGVKLMTA
jgi:hypothetical protein